MQPDTARVSGLTKDVLDSFLLSDHALRQK